MKKLEILARFDNSSDFPGSNRLLWRPKGLAPTCFYFDKNQIFLMKGNDINFTKFGVKIASQNTVAFTFQIP